MLSDNTSDSHFSLMVTAAILINTQILDSWKNRNSSFLLEQKHTRKKGHEMKPNKYFPKAMIFSIVIKCSGTHRCPHQKSNHSSQHLTFGFTFWPLDNVTLWSDVIYPCGCLFLLISCRKENAIPCLIYLLPPDKEAAASVWLQRVGAQSAEPAVFLQNSRCSTFPAWIIDVRSSTWLVMPTLLQLLAVWAGGNFPKARHTFDLSNSHHLAVNP
jgi:hypothetical protein